MLRSFAILATMLFTSATATTATCPQDGQTAYATGNTKKIYTSDGPHMSCEYSHPINPMNGSQGRHVFWQICD